MPKSLLKNKSFILIVLVCVVIAGEFWGGSRYPALDQKALMAGTAGLEPLGFDTIVTVQPSDSIPKKILFSAINWGKTNQRGMTFGLLFAAALLTLFSLFKKRSFEGSLSNSVLGIMIGTPLGVCVNCAAPIAQGLHASGTRLETTVAAMISSPTMNVIVLAMLFSLFPVYIVAIKIGATLAFLLLVLPLLARYVFKDEVMLTDRRVLGRMTPEQSARMTPLDATPPNEEESEKWIPALRWVVTSFIGNLWYIVKMTLPLMLLAGLLGSALVTLLPLESLAELLPESPRIMVLLGLTVAALVGIFLPVPMTFDVIVTAVLMAAGMPVMYAMVLLFTLGIFSIYSFFIVRQTLSLKVALTLFLVLAGIGVVSGVAAHQIHKWDQARKSEFLLSSWSELERPVVAVVPGAPRGEDGLELISMLAPNRMLRSPDTRELPAGIAVASVGLNQPVAHGEALFSRIEGAQVGLDQPYQFSVLRWTQPYTEFRAIASGDVHNDGWVDVALTSQTGVQLYANDQGEFRQQEIAVDGMRDFYVVNTALVDLNDDGWLDLYFSTYREGNYVIYNDAGKFNGDHIVKLPNRDGAWMTAATAFGDLDRDGDLDIVLGNWTLGSFLSRRHLGRESSRNVLLRNNGGDFVIEELEGVDGETLSILMSDINNDGYVDLIVGNDFEVPDLYYLGDEQGGLNLIRRQDGIVGVSSLLTMSIDIADIDNDLVPEIYLANVSGTDNSIMADYDEICQDAEGTSLFDECVRIRATQKLVNRSLNKNSPALCMELADPVNGQECIGLHLYLTSWWGRNLETCRLLQDRYVPLSITCEEYFRIQDPPPAGAWADMIPQAARRSNVVLALNEDGVFKDKALALNLREAGWAWNAKFADLDQDEWQDVYLVNGYFGENRQSGRESNHFFRNLQGREFVDETESANLRLFAETSAYTYADIDNDGDLDIISAEILGPAWLYLNNTTAGNAVSFELEDYVGNRFGIGTRLIAHYGTDGTHQQLREVKASGGFLSFDAPGAHFGIGAFDRVEQLEILWSTGESTRIDGPFDAGRRYRVTRTSSGTTIAAGVTGQD